MAHKGPHISISPDYVVNRILRINIDDFAEWPESVRHLAIAIAEELFLVAYNPFINVETVRNSVHARFERESMALAHYFANAIGEGITMFWSAYEAERSFREELISTLRNILPGECILSSPSALVASATDATDLRMELPLLVVEPDSAEQVAALVKLANDMKFALIPRGGGSGMTGGAVPARKRTVIVSLTRLTKIGPIDLENMTVTVEAGAITQNVIKAVDAAGALFSVDPASKQASSIGGNVSENAGGPSPSNTAPPWTTCSGGAWSRPRARSSAWSARTIPATRSCPKKRPCSWSRTSAAACATSSTCAATRSACPAWART